MSGNYGLAFYFFVLILVLNVIGGNAIGQGGGGGGDALDCSSVVDKYCALKASDSGCPDGYQCYDVGAQDPDVGKCFRDRQNCKPENSKCCDSTDCCRHGSDRNSDQFDCVQTVADGKVCKVLVV